MAYILPSLKDPHTLKENKMALQHRILYFKIKVYSCKVRTNAAIQNSTKNYIIMHSRP